MPTPAHRDALARARAHLARLADAERAFLGAGAYRLEHEHDKRAGRYLVRVRHVAPVPDEIDHAAADVVRGLRDTLDELAAALAGAPTRFPVFESLALFAQRARKAIAPMADEAQAFLEELQPYHAIGGFRNGPLWILRGLDVDQRPLLSPSMLGGTMGVNTQRAVAIEGEPVVTTGRLTEGGIVASAKTRVTGGDPKLDMFFRPDVALAFPKDGPARGRAAVSLLAALRDHVEHTVLAALEPVLASPHSS